MPSPNPAPRPDLDPSDDPRFPPFWQPTDHQRRLMRVVSAVQTATAGWVSDDPHRLDLLRRFRTAGETLAVTADATLGEYAATVQEAVARETGEAISPALLGFLLTTPPFRVLILPDSPSQSLLVGGDPLPDPTREERRHV